MSELITKSGASSASDTYEAYCAGSLGRASTSSSMPFVLPDSDEENSSRQGDTQGENLADQYDLMRHLGSNRSIGSANGSAEDVSSNTASRTTSAPAEGDAPALTSSRAFFSQMSGLRTSMQSASSISTEKLAEKTDTAAISSQKTSGDTRYTIAHFTEQEILTNNVPATGTGIAAHKADMPRTNDTIETKLTGAESGLVGTIRVIERSSPGTNTRRDNEKRDERRSETEASINAGAVAVLDESGATTNDAPKGDAVKLPRMQQISEAILEEMERMSANPSNSSVNLKLDMADGSKLNIRLRWNGSRVKASFDSDSTANLRGEIENGWGSLALQVGNSGIQLDPPLFA